MIESKLKVPALAIVFACGCLPGLAQSGVFEGAATLVLERGAGEGPAWHPEWGLLFSGDGNIHRLSGDGKLEVFLPDAGSNGLLVDKDGTVLVCASRDRRVVRLSPNKTAQVLVQTYADQRFNTPNDLSVDSSGRIYFSDPRYGSRDSMEMKDDAGRNIEGVYRIDPDGSTTRVITHEVDRPNGVLVSLDGRHLFVADNNNDQVGGARKLWRFDLTEKGDVDLKSRFLVYDWGSGRGPDGMAQDEEGRIYSAAGLNRSNPPFEDPEAAPAGIYVLSAEGEKLDFLAIPHDEVTNCDFGGHDWRTLFITAGGRLWKVRTTTPGVAPARALEAAKPVFWYCRYFNAEGEERYLPDGNYADVLGHLSSEFAIRTDRRAPTSALLSKVDVVMISNPSRDAVNGGPTPPRFSKDMVEILAKYVEEGGGLIIQGNQEDHNLEVDSTNELFARFGMRWEPKYTDVKALKIADETAIIGGLRWAYFTGNLVEIADDHPAMPKCLVANNKAQIPLSEAKRDQAGCLLGMAEPGKGRVLVVTDSGWLTNDALAGRELGGIAIRDHDNVEIVLRLCRWLARSH